jgi:hypothetical protein
MKKNEFAFCLLSQLKGKANPCFRVNREVCSDHYFIHGSVDFVWLKIMHGVDGLFPSR